MDYRYGNKRESEKIKKYILEDDGIIYGGSAGAIIFGKDLDSCNTDDDNEVGLIDNTGFNMIKGYSLLCHYTSREEVRTEISKNYLLELSKNKPVYAIPEEDTIYVNDYCIEFIGNRPYYEFLNGDMIERSIYADKKSFIKVISHMTRIFLILYSAPRINYIK